MVEYPAVFRHIGLLGDESPGVAELLFIQSSNIVQLWSKEPDAEFKGNVGNMSSRKAGARSSSRTEFPFKTLFAVCGQTLKDVLLRQPIGHLQQGARRRAKGPRLLLRLPLATLTTNARHDRGFVNVQTRARCVDDLHEVSPHGSSPEDIEEWSNLLCVLSQPGRRQFRVRSDVRIRLTLGLEGTKLITDLVRSRATAYHTIATAPFHGFRVPRSAHDD